jgi:hypothetical protein
VPFLIWLAANPEVLVVGMFLLALSLSQAGVTKPHGESSGLVAALTAPLRAAVALWNSLVRSTISRFASAHLVPIARFFAALNSLVRSYAHVEADLAEEEARAVERLAHIVIPREAGRAAAPAARQAKAATKKATGAAATATATGNQLHSYQARTTPKVNAAHRATTVTLPHDIAHVNGRVTTLDRDIGKLRDRTKALEDGALQTFSWLRAHPLSGTTRVAGEAVAVALASLGFGFLRCRAWRGLGKKVTCGMGSWLSGLLDAVALFALADLGVLNPEVLAKGAVEAVDTVEGILSEILSH